MAGLNITLRPASAGGVEGTRFCDEPAPGGATTSSGLVAKGRMSPLRQCSIVVGLAFAASQLPGMRYVRRGGLGSVSVIWAMLNPPRREETPSSF